MVTLSGTLVRGGTSKCWIFDARDLAGLEDHLDDVLTSAFGAPDPRQIDGVGGATSTTSKAAIVRRSARPGIDLEYLFAQVGIGANEVEWGSNCGNCATAVGLHALQTGLVEPSDPVSTVVMRNSNTGAVLSAAVPTPGRRVPELGEAVVPGSLAPGVPVRLGFLDPVGTVSGSLLPTGRALDHFDGIDATVVDAGAPAVLAHAGSLGATALESVASLEPVVPRLVRLRRLAALRSGLATEDGPVSHAVPKVGMVGPPRTYRTALGERVRAEDYDIAVRMLSMHAPHPAIGLTSAVAVAAAVVTPGTLPAALADGRPKPDTVRLGTPAGIVTVEVEAAWEEQGRESATGGRAIHKVVLNRAARTIAKADLSVPFLLQHSAS
ncbi:PrpF domain-containing protein [Streptomyces sp. NPDC055078]